MKPYLHAKMTVARYKGRPEDYMDIHDFIDSSKSTMADMRHRAILHSAFGIYIVEKVFGTFIVNSDNVKVMTRDIAEDHIIQDLGKIPSVQDWLSNMELQQWMAGPVKKTKDIINLSAKVD